MKKLGHGIFAIIFASLLIILNCPSASALTSIYPEPNASKPTNTVVNTIDGTVINVARLAALGAFNYDYSNYQKNLNNLAVYFTPSGWQLFMNALQLSRNLEAVQNNQLTVTGRIIGDANIINHATINNTETWTVEIPMSVVYADNQNNKLVHKLIVKMLLVRYVVAGNPYGIAVQQFIARPDVLSMQQLPEPTST